MACLNSLLGSGGDNAGTLGVAGLVGTFPLAAPGTLVFEPLIHEILVAVLAPFISMVYNERDKFLLVLCQLVLVLWRLIGRVDDLSGVGVTNFHAYTLSMGEIVPLVSKSANVV